MNDATILADHGYELPSALRDEVAQLLDGADGGDALTRFQAEYLHRTGRVAALDWRLEEGSGPPHMFHGTVRVDTTDLEVAGEGSGPLDAFVDGLGDAGQSVEVLSYHGHTLGPGSDAENVAYVQIAREGQTSWGVGDHRSMVGACVAAIVSAINRL